MGEKDDMFEVGDQKGRQHLGREKQTLGKLGSEGWGTERPGENRENIVKGGRTEKTEGTGSVRNLDRGLYA